MASKWKRAPKKRVCIHQNAEPLSRDGQAPVPAQRMGHTMMHCYICDSSWWEPNSNLIKLGIL